MSARIPQNFIHDLIARTDIVELIQSRLTLKRTGKNYSSRCPFHDEKTPSFTVNPEKQFYYCFGCGAHGNAISFLMNYSRLEFVDAVHELAAKLHVEVPTENDTRTPTKNFKPYYELLEQIAQFYQDQLRVCPQAVAYLKSRGLTGQIAKQYSLGYAPDAWDTLTQQFGNHPTAKQLLLECGMLIQKDTGHHYDRFRNRIMFPIRDSRGRIIAFGGRTMGNEQPKYLNSPETEIFHKGHELYGLYEAHQHHHEFKQILIVEGYMDVIALAQHHLHNTVATLGTAINAKHIQKLLRHTPQLIFCFDGDQAGRNAAWRALTISLPLMHDGIQVKFLFLPQDEDPDTLVRKLGQKEFEKKIGEAQPLAEVLFQHLKAETPIDTLENKASFAKNIKQYLETIPPGVYQQLLYDKLATELQMNSDRLQQTPPPTPIHESRHLPLRKAIVQKPSKNKRILPPEKLAITLLLRSPELSACVPTLQHLKENNKFEVSLLIKLHQLLLNEPNISTGQILTYFNDPNEQQLLAELSAKISNIPAAGMSEELLGAVQRLEEQSEFNLVQNLIEKAKLNTLSALEKEQLNKILLNKTRRKLD